MYLGYYVSQCSQKNQLTFPHKLKELTGSQLLITSWFEKSLVVLPATQGVEILNNVMKETSLLLPEVRDLERLFYGNATTITLDDKNRFVLPKNLREYASIKGEAAFVGVNTRIEVWDKNVYENYGAIREKLIRETAITHYNRIAKQKDL